MRLFACPTIGNDTWVLDDIEPYVTLEGDTVSTVWRFDQRRPDCDPPDDETQWVFRRRPVTDTRYWLGCMLADTVPAGATNIVDPNNAGGWNSEMATPNRRELEAVLGEPNNAFKGMTRREIWRQIVRRTRWRAVFSDGSEVEIGSDV